jgi:hypothetical protein
MKVNIATPSMLEELGHNGVATHPDARADSRVSRWPC